MTPRKPKPKGSKRARPKPGPAKPKPRPAPQNTDHLDASALDASLPLKDARQERFVVNLAMHGMSNGQAYILAGYAVTNVAVGSAAASRLLKDVKVLARLTFLQNRAAALAVDASGLSKADILNMTIEQHQRNMGVRPVTISKTIKTGKDKGKVVTVETYAYNEHAASQTLKLLHDEWGLGQGGSGASGTGNDDIDARARADSPHIIEEMEGVRAARRLILAGGKDVERENSKAAIGAALKKLAGEK